MANLITPLLDIFRRQPQQGVQVSVQPSQTNYNAETGETTTAYKDASGNVITSGMSVPKPESQFPPKTPEPLPFMRHHGGGSSVNIPVPPNSINPLPHETGTEIGYSSLPTQIPESTLQQAVYKANLQNLQQYPSAFGAYSIEATNKNKQFQEYIKNRNPVTGTLDYGVQKGFAFLEKKEVGQPFFGSPDAQRVLKPAVMAGSYFIPVVGEGLAISSAGGQFLTSGGRTELKTSFEKSPTTGVILTGANLVGGTAGFLKTASRINKFAGYPKFQTIGKSFVTGQKEEEGLKVFQTTDVALTEQKNLFGLNDKLFFSTGKSNIIVKPEENNLFQFFGKTSGEQRQVILNPKILFSKPKPISSSSKGIGLQDEGLNYGFIGTKVKGKDIFGFGSFVNAQTDNDLILEYAKINAVKNPLKNPTLGGEEHRIFGLISEAYPKNTFSFGAKFRTSGKPSGKTIEQISNVLTAQASKANIEKTKSLLPELSFLSAVQVEQPSKSEFYGTGQYEKTDFVAIPKESNTAVSQFFTPSVSDKEETRILNIPSVTHRARSVERTATLSLQIPRADEQLRTTPRPIQNIIQIPRQAQPQGYFNPSLLAHRTQTNIKNPTGTFVFVPNNSIKRKTPISLNGFKESSFFSVEARRKGKFKKIGTATTFKDAFNLGIKNVKSNLARSFRIKSPSGYLKLKPLTSEFRKSTNPKDQFSLIQKSSFALSSRSEVSEIQRARKRRFSIW